MSETNSPSNGEHLEGVEHAFGVDLDLDQSEATGQETEAYKKMRGRVAGMLSAVMNLHPETSIMTYGDSEGQHQPIGSPVDRGAWRGIQTFAQGERPAEMTPMSKYLEIKKDDEPVHNFYIAEGDPNYPGDTSASEIELDIHTPDEAGFILFAPGSGDKDAVYKGREKVRDMDDSDLERINNTLTEIYANIPKS